MLLNYHIGSFVLGSLCVGDLSGGLEWCLCCRLHIKLVFYSSTITMMHGPINIRYTFEWKHHDVLATCASAQSLYYAR